MSKHKYAVGERVSVLADRHNSNLRPGVYTITRALPVNGDGVQYRVKSTQDDQERVLDEALLHRVNR